MKLVNLINKYGSSLKGCMALLGVLVLGSCSKVAETDVAEPEKIELNGTRPNIILVMTDDQGLGDLSFTGNEVLKTPNIDQFASQSTRFTDFQVSPTCAPTRAAIMSGRPPFKVGVTHTILQRERMAQDVFTLPQALQSAGYSTGLFGKWHLGDEEEYLPQNRGFDEVLMHGGGGIGQYRFGDFEANTTNTYFDNVLLHNDTIVQTEGFCTDVFFDAGLAWIKKQEQKNQPYFAYISLNAPHGPLIAPEKYNKRFLDLGYDQGTANRYGMIENIDDNFGRLMDYLEKWEALDDTLIIFMTDNGATHLKGKLNGKPVVHFNANMKGSKNSPHEGGTHVPAFWSWKGVTQDVSIDSLTSHIDLYKTFNDLAGVTLPEKMQPLDGRSLLPLIENPTAQWSDRELFIHRGRWKSGKRDEAQYDQYAVRTQQWRLVNSTELYDIAKDPGQLNNLAEEHPEIVQRLRSQFDDWWGEAKPLMVNEGLPIVRAEEQPLTLRYKKQLAQQGIPTWQPDAF